MLVLDVTGVMFSQKVSKRAGINLPFYRVAPCACVAGTCGTGTSPLPRLVKMVAMGAHHLNSLGYQACDWFKEPKLHMWPPW